MTKRVLALISSLVMLINMILPSFTLAEGNPTLIVNLSSNSLSVGEEFTASVKFGDLSKSGINLDTVGSIQVELSYPSDYIEFVSCNEDDMFWPSKALVEINYKEAGKVKYGLIASKGITLSDDDVMFTVTLKAKAVVANANISAMCESLADVKPTSANVSEGSATLTIVNPCTGIKLDRDTLTIARGETATLTATVEPAGTTDNVIWSSEDKTIATVDSNGKVSGVGLGETTITAACGDKTASCKVTVTKATIAGTANIYTKEGFFYGATLGASPLITNAGWETAITTIKWYRDGEADSIATGDKYKIGEKDIGKQLYIIVTADKYTGELKSKLTDVIEKATKDAPAKPIIEANENVITVTNVDPNAEYMLMGDVTDFKFGKATTFKVNYGMTYYVIARYPETATHKESEEAQSDPVTIDKAPCNLTVTAGEGGTVDGIPEGTVREGDKVKLTANPGDFDHKFVKWEVTGITLTEEAAKANPITFTIGSTDVTVKAVFEKKEAVIINFNVLNFTYDGTQKTPEIGPEEVVGMDRTIEYFDSLNNKLKSAPTEAGTYKVKVTFTSSEASEYRKTWADATFTIARAEQTAPAAPTPTNATSNSFELDIVAEQEYVISTTQATPAESEWKQGTELTSPVTGLKPATTYYVFTRVKGNNNYNPSPAVYATVTTAHTYAWKVEGSGVVGVNVRVGGTLHESLKGTIKNTGTGELTGITATIDNETNFTLEAVPGTLASKGSLNITVKPKDIKTDKAGEYKAAVTVKAKDVSDITVNFTIKVTEKETAEISGITDTTVTFNGKTQGIDLSKAVVTGGGEALDASKLTVTYDAAETRNAGEYIATIKYEDADYIGSTTAKLIINKQDVTVTGFKAQSKVYDGNADAAVDSTNAKLYGMIEGTVVGFDKSGLTFKFDDKNVGTSKAVKNTAPITLTGTDAGNYNLTNPIVELTADITAKPVTVTAAVAEKTYDGLTNNAAVTLSAPELIAGDDVQFDKVTGTYVTADAGDAVEVEVNYAISGADRGNYNITKAEEKTYGKVNKADLNVTLTAPAAVTYDGKTHEVSGVKDNGRVEADKGKTLYTLTYAGGDALPVDAGIYSATAKLTAEGSKNYNLKANTVDVVIDKADMSATNKEYTVAFMLAGAQSRKLSDLQLTPANVSGKWSVTTGTNEILDGEAKIDGENLMFTVKSGLTTADIGKKVELTLTFTPDKNYNPVTATVTVTLAQDTYTNSIVGTLPTQVKLGDALDLSGVKLVTKFGSGAPEQQLDVNDDTKVEVTTTYDHAAKEIGVKTVTFTDKANGGITYTHTFTVVDVLEGVKLAADQIEYNYKLKEATTIGFDGKIHAVYKSGAKKALNHADVVLTMSDGTVVDSAKEARLLNTLGTATITITYTEKYLDGTSDKQSVDITVSVTAAPVKPDGKPNAEGFAVTPIPDAGKEMEYKDDAGNKVEPENVQGKLAYAAPGTLEEEVKKNPAFNNVGNGDVVYENISFKDENGKPVTFANGKMQVTVPYPADSDKGDEFVMLIPDGEGKMKAIVPQKTAGGLQFEIENSNVTFAIGWYTPAPSPVLPTEPERDPEDNFWNEVYWTLLRSGQGSVITANAGYYDRVPQGVLRAVDISGNTLIINSAFGVQVVVTPGALEKLGMYRIFYPISYLKEMLKGSSVISGSGTTGITVGVLMPTTGDATVVEHPYTMTPATAGIIPGLESAANARPVIDNADGVSVLDGAQRNEGAVIGGGMLIGLGLLALLGAAYVTMRKRGN